MPGMIYEESPEEPHLVSRVVTVQIFLVTSDISSELLSCANELRVRACRSKLALAIYGNKVAINLSRDHKWSNPMASLLLQALTSAF